jgi:hypothetical protein
LVPDSRAAFELRAPVLLEVHAFDRHRVVHALAHPARAGRAGIDSETEQRTPEKATHRIGALGSQSRHSALRCNGPHAAKTGHH